MEDDLEEYPFSEGDSIFDELHSWPKLENFTGKTFMYRVPTQHRPIEKLKVASDQLISNFVHAGGRYPSRNRVADMVWRARGGILHRVGDMTNEHIINCLKILSHNAMSDMLPETDVWINIFEKELSNRQADELLASCESNETELYLGNNNEGDTTMTNYSAAAFVVNDEVLAVDVEFDNSNVRGKRFTYKSAIENLAVGDKVVAPFGSDFIVGTVVSLDADINSKSSIQYKWLVQKVDFVSYNQVLENEANMITELKKVDRKASREKMRQEWLEHGGEKYKDIKLLTTPPSVVDIEAQYTFDFAVGSPSMKPGG